MKRRRPTKFESGVLCAAGFIASDHGKPSMAADMLRCMGMNYMDLRLIDEYDSDKLKLIIGENGIDFLFKS